MNIENEIHPVYHYCPNCKAVSLYAPLPVRPDLQFPKTQTYTCGTEVLYMENWDILDSPTSQCLASMSYHG